MQTTFGAYRHLLLDSTSSIAAGGTPGAHAFASHPSPPPMGTFDVFPGSSGPDHFEGTPEGDEFDLGDGGKDFANGLGGSDIFLMGAGFGRTDTINGGDDRDVMILDGDYSAGLTLAPTTMTGVEEVDFVGGHSYTLKLNDANLVPFGANDGNVVFNSYFFTGSSLGADDSLNFDGSAERNSAMTLYGGPGNDILTSGGGRDLLRGGLGTNVLDGGGGEDRASHSNVGTGVTIDLNNTGAQEIGGGVVNTYRNIEDISGNDFNDTLTGNAGANWVWGQAGDDTLTGNGGNDRMEGAGGTDTMDGGAGHNTFVYGHDLDDIAAESMSSGFDTIVAFDFSKSVFELTVAVNAIDHSVKAGRLNDATFDDDLAKAVNSDRLLAHDALLYMAKNGDHAGQTFLIVDVNGDAGYQASADLVIRLDGALHSAAFSLNNFTMPPE